MSAGRALRLGRIVVSLVVLAAATVFFASLSAKTAAAVGWVEVIQILPLSLATCLSTLGCWLVVTLIFGRIYCSTACPLGTVQDIAARLPRLQRDYRRRHPYHFAPAKNLLRYAALALFFSFVFLGFTRIPALVAPFDIFGQAVSDFILPIVEWLGGKEVIAISAYSFVITLFAVGALTVVAWQRGRLFCNTLCPVGNGLSLFSRFSIYHFDIDTDICTNCRRCEHVCKAQCINLSDHLVDGSRCVVCFDCVDSCPDKAIRYTRRRKQLSIPMLQRIPPLTSPSPSPSSQTSQFTQASKPTK